MSFSTWNWPYHLFTLESSIIGWSDAAGIAAACAIEFLSALLVTGVELALQIHAVTRHGEAEHPIDLGAERIALDLGAEPVGVPRARADDVQEVVEADDRHQRGVLRQADEVVDDAGNGDAQGLRQDDEPHHLPIAEAHRHGAFVLALRQGLQPAAHHD